VEIAAINLVPGWEVGQVASESVHEIVFNFHAPIKREQELHKSCCELNEFYYVHRKNASKFEPARNWWDLHNIYLACELNKSHISTDEDPGLRIESFAVINLRGVSTNKKYYCCRSEPRASLKHRVETYRDVTSVPTFLCALSASY
jgi:hypothetical protein